MKTKIGFFALMILTFVLAACVQPTAAPQPPTTQPPQATPTEAIQPITKDTLGNGSYPVREGNETVPFTGGKYETGQGADYISASLMPQITLGDLNGDGVGDAAVLIAENYGGSGTFIYLVPVIATSEGPKAGPGTLLGDRVQVKSMDYKDGKVQVSMLVQGPNDPQCCPSLPQTRTFEYYANEGFILTGVTSQTADGKERSITIDSPVSDSEVSSPMNLKGSVTIAPFENTLAVRIYDAGGNQVSEGPISVTATEMGGPGTFDTQVDLAAASVPAGPIRVEVLDLSAADGSILAMSSVTLTYK
jgi:Immunoglobulin-like domain of bacterial spore germination